MLPSTGWLPKELNLNDSPESWDLPEDYVCTYDDPGPVIFPSMTDCVVDVPDFVSVEMGDAYSTAEEGWGDTVCEEALEISLIQTGVFGVVLFDSIVITEPSIVCTPEPPTVAPVPVPDTGGPPVVVIEPPIEIVVATFEPTGTIPSFEQPVVITAPPVAKECPVPLQCKCD